MPSRRISPRRGWRSTVGWPILTKAQRTRLARCGLSSSVTTQIEWLATLAVLREEEDMPRPPEVRAALAGLVKSLNEAKDRLSTCDELTAGIIDSSLFVRSLKRRRSPVSLSSTIADLREIIWVSIRALDTPFPKAADFELQIARELHTIFRENGLPFNRGKRSRATQVLTAILGIGRPTTERKAAHYIDEARQIERAKSGTGSVPPFAE